MDQKPFSSHTNKSIYDNYNQLRLDGQPLTNFVHGQGGGGGGGGSGGSSMDLNNHHLQFKHEALESTLGFNSDPTGAYRFPQQTLMDKIRNDEKGMEDYRCPTCCQRFDRAREFLEHQQQAHPTTNNLQSSKTSSSNPSSCMYKTTKRQSSSKNEQKSDGRTWECGECDKVFRSYPGFYLHKRTHEGLTYTCPEASCAKTFTQKGSLTTHLKLHRLKKSTEDSQPLQCEDCPKRYKSPAGLYLHKQSIHNRRVWSCPECAKSFKSYPGYYLHKKGHEGISYECPVCLKAFTQKGSLNTHLKTHRGSGTSEGSGGGGGN